jgi:H+/Cl- antiporter ClcA
MTSKAKADLNMDVQPQTGVYVGRSTVFQRARRIVSVGLLGAAIAGVAAPFAAPLGAALFTYEAMGLAAGLLAGAVLTSKHLL